MRQLEMTRDEMIRLLVEFSVRAALGDPRRYWLSDLFERGFVGYRKFSDRRLWLELQLRGLVETDDVPAEVNSEYYAPGDDPAILGLPVAAAKKEIE